MEWFILCLIVPAIIVPIVVLWGFAGCSFQGNALTAPVFTANLTEDQAGFEDSCLVQPIKLEQALNRGTRIYIKLRGPEVGALTLDRIYISNRAVPNDPSDPANPSPLPWDSPGPNSPGTVQKLVDIDTLDEAVRLPIRNSDGSFRNFIVLGPITLHFDCGPDLLIAFDINRTPGQGRIRQGNLANSEFYRRQPAHQAAAPNRTDDFLTVTGKHALVEGINVI